MVSSVTARRSRSLQRNRNTVKFGSSTNKLGPVSNVLLLGLILSLLGLIYLTQITKTTAFGYRVNDLESRKSELVKERQSLEVEVERLRALERVRSSEVASQLVPANQATFIQ